MTNAKQAILYTLLVLLGIGLVLFNGKGHQLPERKYAPLGPEKVVQKYPHPWRLNGRADQPWIWSES